MRFFYHYNKPASAQRGHPTISLHFKGKCHLVDQLDCGVPTNSRTHETSPKFVMVGDAKTIRIKEGLGVIR